MRKNLCNRCDSRYRPRDGGKLTLKHGRTEIEAKLCNGCYKEMVRVYRQ